MDCSNNQRGSYPRRPQMPPPPCMNTNFSCGCGEMQTPSRPPRPVRPEMPMRPEMPIPVPYSATMPSSDVGPDYENPSSRPACGSPSPRPAHTRPSSHRRNSDSDCSDMPIGMGYVPWQVWNQPYPLEKGFVRGTIFPELDLPFVMGRCRG